MKSVNVKFYALIAFLAAIMSFSACNKSKDPGQAVVKFSSASAGYDESAGIINVEVAIDHTVSTDVTVNFSWSGTSTTFLDGDFQLVTPIGIVIPAGQLTGQIQLSAIDDTQLDDDDLVILTLSGTSSNAKVTSSETDKKFNVTIRNNDELPDNTLQIDLTWDQGVGTDIDGANLDLFLNYNVEESGTTITDIGTSYLSSHDATGFATLKLGADGNDDTYYIVVAYTSGSGNVNFYIAANGLGYVDSGHGNFDASEAGSDAFFYGPYTKSGNTFGRAFLTPKTGKIFSYKVPNFFNLKEMKK